MKAIKDEDFEITKETIDLVIHTDDVDFIMEVADTSPKFIKEVIDLAKENDPEIIKEIIDLTKNSVKIEVVELMDNDPKFIK